MKGKLLFLIIVIFFLLIYHRWIFQNSILTYGDWYYFYKETLLTTRMSYFNIWISDFNLGSIVVGLAQAPTWGAYGLLAKLFGFDYSLSLKIIHLFPIIIFTPLTSFILAKFITKKNYPAIVGMIVYSFNSYFLTLQTGHLTLMVAFSLLPLLLYLFMRGLDERSIFIGSVSSVVFSIICAYEPRVAYQGLVILFIYYLLSFVPKTKERISKRFIYNSIYAGVPIMLFVLINFYWILALFQMGTISTNEFFSRSLFGNEFLNIMYAFSLFHPFWTGGMPSIFTLQPINLTFWITPLVAFLGLYLGRKRVVVIFFGILALIGIFLTKQSSIPFETVYLWLYNHFPGFNAYREATKFFAFIVIGYSILISVFMEYVLEFYKKGKLSKYFVVFIFLVVSGLFLINSKPLLTGEINTMFKPREIPQDYLLFKNKMLSEGEYSRTLWIPTFSRWGLITLNHPEVSLVELLNSSWKSYIPLDISSNTYNEGDLMVRMMQTPIFKKLIDQSSVKYIVIPIQDKENDDDFYQFYGRSRQYYIDNINKLKYLKKVDLGYKNLLIYQNLSFRPHIYISDEKETFAVPLSSLQPVSYKMISPTKYTFTISNLSNPSYLYFSDAYNHNWTLLPADSNQKITSTKSSGGMNSFYLSKDWINNNLQVDGVNSIVSGTLYFKPQDMVHKGIIISVFSLGCVLLYQILYLFKRFVLKK